MEKKKYPVKCWWCEKETNVELAAPPEIGDGLIDIAEKLSWISAIDFLRERVLIFCSPECQKKAKTIAGHYRKTRKSTGGGNSPERLK